jgi:MacB-like periplasmic core domain
VPHSRKRWREGSRRVVAAAGVFLTAGSLYGSEKRTARKSARGGYQRFLPIEGNMRALTSLRTALGFLFRRRRAEREMEEELRAHLRRRANDLERQGLPRAEAERQARIEFGGYQRYKEECREALGTRLLSELIADVRYGLRQLRRNLGFTAVAVITLALGIGASTAIFSVVYPVLVNPYPYKGADRMVDFTILGRTKGDERDWYSLDEFRAIRDQNRVFDGVVGYSAVNWVLSGEGLPEIVFVTAMTGDAFRYFGVPPLLGRVFTRADAPRGKTAAAVAVLSFRFWKRRYGDARNVLGKAIRLDGKPYTIIGVLPARFALAWG